MRDGGRIAAAIGVLEAVEGRHATVRRALKSWGDAARYAGSHDRAFVAGLSLDALRRRRSMAWAMDDASPRAAVLGVLRFGWDWPATRIGEACAEDHGPGALGGSEAERLERPVPLDRAPAPILGDYPDWLDASFARVFGEERAEAAAALACRAPVDLRVNRLKARPDQVQKALAPFQAAPVGLLETALRIAAPQASARASPVEATPAFEKGWFEVQDLGSQIAAARAGTIAHRQVLDFCAGGGGKTLALAALMENTGQLFAFDIDAGRLAETVRRARRAGVRNLQVRSPLEAGALNELEGRMDLVFVDAPCTGTGTWRRHPDAKWRLTPAQLDRRIAEQDKVLGEAARFVRPEGRLIYVTCSLLAEENEDRVAAFLSGHSAFAPVGKASRLAPHADGTDGFFIVELARASG